jgi:hypothetical protein
VRVGKLAGGDARPDPLHSQVENDMRVENDTVEYVRDEPFVSWPPASAWTNSPLRHAWLRQLFRPPSLPCN